MSFRRSWTTPQACPPRPPPGKRNGTFEGRGSRKGPGGHTPEVTKGVALALLLGALTAVPPRQRLLTVFMLLGRLSPEDAALEAQVAAVEKVAEDWREGVLSTPACWQDKSQDTWIWGQSTRVHKKRPGLCARSLRRTSVLTVASHTAARLGHRDTTHRLSSQDH